MASLRWSSVLACCFATACVPSLSATPAVDVTPRSATTARADLDPRVDPSVFDIDKSSEADARRLAEQRCGLDYEMLGARTVTRTTPTECKRGLLASALKGSETTKSNAPDETCTPGSSWKDTVYRFRCGGASASH